MKSRIYIVGALLFLLFAQSCERDITIDIPVEGNFIVVEGIIEAGEAPKILITRNTGFFDPMPVDMEDFIEKFIVRDAKVQVSDGTNTYELQFVINPFQYPYVYYTTSEFTGEINRTYTLTVEAGGKQLHSVTTIPPPIAIDSSWFGLNIFDTEEDSLGFVFLRITDPDTIGNGFRLYSKKSNSPEYFPVSGSALNDQFVNGRTFEFFAQQSQRPFGTADTFIRENYYYTLGDTIHLKFCSMGWREVEFYNTFEAAKSTNGNPFASPVMIKSNIEGGMGVWCGLSSFKDTVIAVK